MRIASLAPSATIMLQEMGVAADIVACTTLCPLPRQERKTKAVGTFSVLHMDRVARLQPDVVITATLVQARGAVRLREAGFRVLHLDPRRLVDIAENYLHVGMAVEQTERGEALRQAFLETIAQFSTVTSDESELPTVYMEEWHAPPYVAGNWVPDMVRLAGGVPVLTAAGEPSKEISLAALRHVDPDVIVQHVCLPPLLPEQGKVARRARMVQREHQRQQLLRRPGWDSLRAVQAGHVYSLNDTPFNTPTSGVGVGIEKLREVLHKISEKSPVEKSARVF